MSNQWLREEPVWWVELTPVAPVTDTERLVGVSRDGTFLWRNPRIPFRLSEQELHTLSLRADLEQRTVSQLVRLLLRDVLASAA